MYRRPMIARSVAEAHRAATPLELFFDLCFVVAVAQAAAHLHHALSNGEFVHAATAYLPVFFGIWWAWINFTWFASAYDTDDDLYRLMTLVQISGALIMAAGVPRAFDSGDFLVVTLGYVVMRLALVGQWLRAARDDAEHRTTALRFAVGVSLVQTGWVLRLLLPQPWYLVAGLLLVVCELAVPVWAERAEGTTWHAGHIAERYGLFTLIVLGEAVLSTTLAFQAAADSGHGVDARLLVLAGSALAIVFCLWWLYFDRDQQALLGRAAMVWGYGHFLIFAATAAVGAGLAVAVDHLTRETRISAAAAGLALGVPVAVWLVAVWLLHVCPLIRGWVVAAGPVAAALVLAAAWTPDPVPVVAVVLVALTVLTTWRVRR